MMASAFARKPVGAVLALFAYVIVVGSVFPIPAVSHTPRVFFASIAPLQFAMIFGVCQ